MTAKITAAIAARQPFTEGNVSAYVIPGGSGAPLVNAGRATATTVPAGATYVVQSYGTPVAWDGPNGPEVTTERHSVTTSKHVAAARRAFGIA